MERAGHGRRGAYVPLLDAVAASSTPEPGVRPARAGARTGPGAAGRDARTCATRWPRADRRPPARLLRRRCPGRGRRTDRPESPRPRRSGASIRPARSTRPRSWAGSASGLPGGGRSPPSSRSLRAAASAGARPGPGPGARMSAGARVVHRPALGGASRGGSRYREARLRRPLVAGVVLSEISDERVGVNRVAVDYAGGRRRLLCLLVRRG